VTVHCDVTAYSHYYSVVLSVRSQIGVQVHNIKVVLVPV
jgi:hypothetical protein